jgi:hypothetical protein
VPSAAPVSAGPDEQDHRVAAILLQGRVGGRLRILAEGRVFARLRHADHLAVRRIREETKPLADRIVARPEAIGEHLVDHGHAQGRFAIAVGEVAAPQQRNAERRKIPRRRHDGGGNDPRGCRLGFSPSLMMVLNSEPVSGAARPGGRLTPGTNATRS